MQKTLVMLLLTLWSTTTFAAPEDFHAGTIIKNYGLIASVPGATLPKDAKFKVAFDVSAAAEGNTVNRQIEKAARFLNMHAEMGVKPENMSLAVVIHGPASRDITTDAKYGGENPNAGLIKALSEAGVKIILCGQTAAFRNIAKDELLPDVETWLSAMTAHALLQQDGYSLNPF